MNEDQAAISSVFRYDWIVKDTVKFHRLFATSGSHKSVCQIEHQKVTLKQILICR